MGRWNLQPAKSTAFTTDNGTNIVKACQLADFMRFQCFGHRLNPAVTNSIKDDPRVSRVVGVCRKLTTHFAHSFKKKMAPTAAQVELNVPRHSLVADCETQWGSKLKLMESLNRSLRSGECCLKTGEPAISCRRHKISMYWRASQKL